MAKTADYLWRSLLFVPANAERFIAKAPETGADGIILDLEDSIAATQKQPARDGLPDVITRLAGRCGDLLVRINGPLRQAVRDLEVAVCTEVKAIVIPKVENAAEVKQVAQIIEEIEAEKNLPVGATQLIALIETVDGLSQLREIAHSSERLSAMLLGPEDFSASAGMLADPETLQLPNQLLVFAARSAGVTPMGFPGSIADFSDLDKFRNTIKLARRMGFCGGFCIHPKQVAVMNQEFAPSSAELAEAEAIIQAYEKSLSNGEAVINFQGRMIDLPVVVRARGVLHLQRRIAERGVTNINRS